MCDLPKERVECGGAFEKIGMDLAGPIIIKASTLRMNKIVKVWIAVFVCLATKATHLEIVSSLSTEDFLGALSRMTSRRGSTKEIWSDNGTNFQGANRQLKQTWKTIVDECIDKLAIQEVSWKFIPRYSPTFGGLWEACVKSMKYFVKRMGSTTNLSYEQFYTLLCRIESLLNSRPLFPNPLEPSDSLSLTPFHFLTSRSLKVLPIEAVNESKTPLTKKWLKVLQIQREFWDKFKTEYLFSLQKRQKWLNHQPNMQIGDVVLIKEPNVSPDNWKMGKVSKIYQDLKGVTRKVGVQNSQQKESIQAVNQLVPLIQKEEQLDTTTVRTRSKRTNISATQVLITWLTLISSANAFNLTVVSPGIHLMYIQDVYIKATILNFIVETNFNIIHDMSLLNNAVTELNNFCQTLNEVPNVKSFCLNVSEAFTTRANDAILDIKSKCEKDLREKRWISFSFKALAKHIPALVTAGVMYQEHQIYNLEKENQQIKEKIRKASMLILNITELEHDEVDGKLTEMIKFQQETNMIAEINTFLSLSMLMIDTMNQKYTNLENMKPYKELAVEYEKLQHEIPEVMLPPVGDVFSITQKRIITNENGVITIDFKIPLVFQEKMTHYRILNIPDQNGNVFELPNEDHIFEIIMNSKNSSYFIITSGNKIAQHIYDTSRWQVTDSCLLMIFSQNIAANSCMLTHSPIKTNKIIHIEDNLALVLAIQNISAICNDRQSSFEATASIIDYSDCVITVGSEMLSNISLSVNMEDPRLPLHINPPEIKLANFSSKHDELDKLKHELEETLDDDSTEAYERNGNILTICLIIIFIAVAVLSSVAILIYQLKKRCKKSGKQVEQWDGPLAEDRHRVPEGVLFLK